MSEIVKENAMCPQAGDFQVGDIISARGPGCTRELWDRKMRVTSVDASTGLPTLCLLPLEETQSQRAERARAALRRAK